MLKQELKEQKYTRVGTTRCEARGGSRLRG